MGTPATAVLSLIATVRPASGPSPRPVISVRTYQAPSGLSPGSGVCQSRCGGCGALRLYSCSTAAADRTSPPTAGAKSASSASVNPKLKCLLSAASCVASGGVMDIAAPDGLGVLAKL